MISLLLGIVERGLIFALIVMAVYLTSRVIHFDDLTVEGSFGIGGACTAAGLSAGMGWLPALLLSLGAGALAGFVTGLLYTRLKLNNLISGIIVTTGLFSLTLKIGTANKALPGTITIFDLIPSNYKAFILLPVITGGIFLVLRWFLTTEIGYLLYAVGDNPALLTSMGKNNHTYKILALMLSNMLTALAGSLFVQYVGYFSLWASVGILVIALAGLIIGELGELLGSGFSISLIFGAIAYQALIAGTFELHINQEWNKLITACMIVTLLLITKHLRQPHA